jgi:hypothetical protein
MLKSALALAGLAASIAGVTAVSAADHRDADHRDADHRYRAKAASVAPVHILLVALPDGSMQQVRYTGDVAPWAVPVAAVDLMSADPMLAAFGSDSPFAMMDRISAEMDARMAGLMQQAATMQAMTPDQLRQAAIRQGGPAGTTSFTMISTSGGNGQTCSRSVRTVSTGDGKAPQVIRTSSGDCGSAVNRPQGLTPAAAPAAKATAPVTPAVLPAKVPAARPDPDTI